jgi:membrane-bound lytic murein transglycosylase D
VAALSLCVGCGQASFRQILTRATQPPWRVAESESEPEAIRSAPPEAQNLSLVASHPRVVSTVDKLNRFRHDAMRLALSRGGRYIDLIAREFTRENVPAELAYLPIIESGFSHNAVGSGGVGLWQLTKQTAESYGLVVNQDVDERKDPEKASRAAARLLRDLYATFESWDLALAAYNAGAGRIQQARSRDPDADFWRLADRGLIPNTTRRYVPEALSTLTIASQPEQFGLDDIERYEPLRYETFLVSRRLDLRTVASLCGSSSESIAELNPSLRRGIVPGMKSGFALRLPEGSAERFATNYEALVDSGAPAPAKRISRSGKSRRAETHPSRGSAPARRGREARRVGA